MAAISKFLTFCIKVKIFAKSIDRSYKKLYNKTPPRREQRKTSKAFEETEKLF